MRLSMPSCTNFPTIRSSLEAIYACGEGMSLCHLPCSRSHLATNSLRTDLWERRQEENKSGGPCQCDVTIPWRRQLKDQMLSTRYLIMVEAAHSKFVLMIPSPPPTFILLQKCNKTNQMTWCTYMFIFLLKYQNINLATEDKTIFNDFQSH
jgi:hypothetical protein